MILIPDNEYSVVLDSCVLAPMPICDTLLRVADSFVYRPLWSHEILSEVRGVLTGKLGYTKDQASHRTEAMRAAFPEACVKLPKGFSDAFECIPDPKDRHVLAAAVKGQANGIVTFNVKDFPDECMTEYGIVRHTPNGFLINQFDLNPMAIIDALNAQAAAMRESRDDLIGRLATAAPEFAERMKHYLSR